jgi:predicted regulator of amino acid metabolism with ACT domain
MWHLLTKYFQRYPAQSRVAQMLLRYGLAVREDGVYCDTIAIPDTSIARAAQVDRRVISAAIETIQREPELRQVFSKLTPTCHLKDAAPQMGWGVLEIVPNDAQGVGILADVATIISKRNISIRQAIVDDPELQEEPRLYIVTEGPLPVDVIPEIRSARGVKSVTLL